jgi:hypothetical protein
MRNELVCLAGLQLVEQLLHVPLHLGEFLYERGAGALSCNNTVLPTGSSRRFCYPGDKSQIGSFS